MLRYKEDMIFFFFLKSHWRFHDVQHKEEQKRKTGMQECYPHKQGKAAGADSIYCGPMHNVYQEYVAEWTIVDEKPSDIHTWG